MNFVRFKDLNKLLCNYKVIAKFNYISKIINYDYILWINYKWHSITWKNL